MNVKKPIIAGMMSLAALAPCKAQKAVRFMSETGVTGVINKEASFYTGMNVILPRGKNMTDFYVGTGFTPDKTVFLDGLIINNYTWTKNLSSWARELFTTSKNWTKSTLEIAPLRANTEKGRFHFSLAPAYTMYADFKNGEKCSQGVNTIFQTTYSLSQGDQLFFEAKYMSEPAKNLLKTHFGKLKNNISYMVSYMKNF